MPEITDILIDVHLDASDLQMLSDRCYLVLTELEQTPPHCFLLQNNCWYSLNYRDCKINTPSDILFKTLLSKRKAALFLELSMLICVSDIKELFSRYRKIDVDSYVTCITPIKEIFNRYGYSFSSTTLLYEMIEILMEDKQIKKVYAINYSENFYSLIHYSTNELSKLKQIL